MSPDGLSCSLCCMLSSIASTLTISGIETGYMDVTSAFGIKSNFMYMSYFFAVVSLLIIRLNCFA